VAGPAPAPTGIRSWRGPRGCADLVGSHPYGAAVTRHATARPRTESNNRSGTAVVWWIRSVMHAAAESPRFRGSSGTWRLACCARPRPGTLRSAATLVVVRCSRSHLGAGGWARRGRSLLDLGVVPHVGVTRLWVGWVRRCPGRVMGKARVARMLAPVSRAVVVAHRDELRQQMGRDRLERPAPATRRTDRWGLRACGEDRPGLG